MEVWVCKQNLLRYVLFYQDLPDGSEKDRIHDLLKAEAQNLARLSDKKTPA